MRRRLPRLYGRNAERAALRTLLAKARDNQSGTVVIRGEPGIGKSALLSDLTARADGFRILHAAGVEAESTLPFAGVHQLLHPILDLTDDIPRPQAAAVRRAFGLTAGGNADPFLVGAGILSLLARTAEEGPLLCVVDDIQWLDTPSLEALLFAARRLEVEAIALVFATRDDERYRFPTNGFTDLQLEGLDPGSATALLEDRAPVPLSKAVRKELVEFSRGNPLVLLELPLSLTDGQLAGREPLAEPLPLTATLEQVFGARAESLSKESQALLLIAAADDTSDPAIVLEAARTLGIEEAALEECEAAGLIGVHETQIRFRHPLVRSAIYHRVPFSRRREVHLALAEVTDERDADRRAWHLAAATIGPDDSVAEALEKSAARARARGGTTTAATALARAAALTRDHEQRARRQLAAARAAADGGMTEVAIALLEEARELTDARQLRGEIDSLRGSIELADGSPSAAYELLLSAASQISDEDPASAARVLVEASIAATVSGDLSRLSESGRRAEALDAALGTTPVEVAFSAGLAALWAGDAREGSARLNDAISRLEVADHPGRYAWAAVAALHLGDDARALALSSADADLARREGAVTRLVRALGRASFAEVSLGRLDSARMSASEGLALATGAGLQNFVCFNHALLAWVAALRGRAEEVYGHAEAALEPARARGRHLEVAVATVALGELELSVGRPVQALVHFEALSGVDSLAAQPYVCLRNTPSLVDAAARAGRLEVATANLADFEKWVGATASRSSALLLARCRALAAATEDWRSHFEDALRVGREHTNPFEHARTALFYGERLRRAGKRAEARGQLRAALELFEQVGARVWAGRAEAELRASGETARKRTNNGRGTADLTPQELQIARLVAAGATNKDVAAQLFLSPRTVDAHLRNVFRKRGVTSRAQLRLLGFGEADSG